MLLEGRFQGVGKDSLDGRAWWVLRVEGEVKKETIVWVALRLGGSNVRNWTVGCFNVSAGLHEEGAERGSCVAASLEAMEEEACEVLEIGAVRVLPKVTVKSAID